MATRHELDAIYRATSYIARTQHGEIILRIDEAHPVLDNVLAQHGATSWAYLTAYNPGSVRLSDADNAVRQRELLVAIEQAGHPYHEGAGVGDGWEPEPSLLVLRISEADAVALGRRFGQNAIVVGEQGGPARLVWL